MDVRSVRNYSDVVIVEHNETAINLLQNRINVLETLCNFDLNIEIVNACECIQKNIRKFLKKRTLLNKKLIAFYKLRYNSMYMKRNQNAAMKIQSLTRAFLGKNKFHEQISASKTIQRVFRYNKSLSPNDKLINKLLKEVVRLRYTVDEDKEIISRYKTLLMVQRRFNNATTSTTQWPSPFILKNYQNYQTDYL